MQYSVLGARKAWNNFMIIFFLLRLITAMRMGMKFVTLN